MDYTYFNPTQQQPYDFMGMPAAVAFPHNIDPKTVNTIETSLDGGFGAPSYDGFGFSGLAPGSPDLAATGPTLMPLGSLDSGLGIDIDDGRAMTTRSSSEEKEAGLTPAQTRRKAQNRAAQRAFRERKERHVRDLEAKLTALESNTHSLQSDNERLKLALQRARTENELLRASSGQQSPLSPSRPLSVNFPAPGAYFSTDVDNGAEGNVRRSSEADLMNERTMSDVLGIDHVHARSKIGKGREVPASQLWDLMQAHPLVQQGIVDIADVCEQLKGEARCYGQGPVFDEGTICAVIEASKRSGGDALV